MRITRPSIRTVRARLFLFLTSLAAVDTASAQAANSSSPASAEETASGGSVLEEVVVSSRRRTESLQDVPLSVVAVSGEQLEQRSIDNLSDLANSTPNFTFGHQAQGGAAAGVPFIRGVGQRDPNMFYDSPVGIYLDGVYMGRMYGNNLDMMDVQRVEVLRGPQGTLFGKNTSGGAINIVTQQPDTNAGAFSGRAMLGSGSRNRMDVVAATNIPLVPDFAAVRFAGSWNQQDGYGTRLDGQEMANTDRWSARAQLLLTPGQDFSILLSGDYLRMDERNVSFKLVDTVVTGPIAAYNAARDPDYDDRWLSVQDYFYNGGGPNYVEGDIWGVSLVLTYDAGWATLKSISAYRESDIGNGVDPDGSPINIVEASETVRHEQVSQELQLTGTALGDRLDWIMGAYYFQEQGEGGPTFSVLTALVGNAASFTNYAEVENTSAAVFGQGSYSVTDRLNLTLGLRFTDDSKEVLFTRRAYPSGAPLLGPLPGDHSSSAWSPRVGLDYQWTPDVMTYVSAAHGAKNGGFNGRATTLADFVEFEDETVWTYEVGVRSEIADGRVRINATAFYSAYKNLQIQIGGAQTIGGVPVPFSLITNIRRARVTGGELELSFIPTNQLTLTAGVGLTDGKYTELPTDSRFTAYGRVNENTPFTNTPEVAYTLGASYRKPLSQSLDLLTRLDYSYRSESYFSSAGPEISTNLTQPSYGLLNARLTFEMANGLALSVFGTNLTDETYIIGGYDDSTTTRPSLGFSTTIQGRPREWGATAQYRF